MKRFYWAIIAGIVMLSIYLPADEKAKGYLFIIGGGSRSEQMMKQYAALAKKNPHQKTVVFPMASGSPEETGQSMKEELTGLGLQEVEVHVLNKDQAGNPENLAILDGVGSVYFTGGDQSLLTQALVDTPIQERLLEIYKNGGVIGGTSAGAAVMSELMITGNEKTAGGEEGAFEKILADNIEVIPGLGFIKTAIIDQHFVARKRHNRLISLILEYPDLLGIGIDESTAIIIKPGNTFKVIGEQNVIVYDASEAGIKIWPDKGISGHNITMHILKPGDHFDLKTRSLI